MHDPPLAPHLISRQPRASLPPARPTPHTEIALVGDGPDSYQVWLGGSPALTRVAYTYQEKVKMGSMEDFFSPLFESYKRDRKAGEAFGDWAWRLGKDGVKAKVGV